MADKAAIEVGDRFETRDSRDAGRVVEVTKALGLSDQGQKLIEMTRWEGIKFTGWGQPIEEHIEWLRQSHTFYTIRTEVHPKNPSAVGRNSRIHEGTLAAKYKKVSR